MADADRPPQGVVRGAHTAAAAPSSTAAGQAQDPAQPAAERGGQLPLLPEPSQAEGDALLPIAPAAISKAAATGKGGRPLGARNRRTDLVAQYVVDRYGDPLEAHMAVGMMPLKDLVTLLRSAASDVGLKLGMSLGDIVRFQKDCRDAALPYIHAKRAPEDQKGEPVAPTIGMVRTTVVAGAAHFHGAGQSIEDRVRADRAAEKTIEHQEDSDNAPAKSHDE